MKLIFDLLDWLGNHPSFMVIVQIAALAVLVIFTASIASSASARHRADADEERRRNSALAIIAFHAALLALKDTIRACKVNPFWVFRDDAAERLRECIRLLERVDAKRLCIHEAERHAAMLKGCDDCFSLLKEEVTTERHLHEAKLLDCIERLFNLLEGKTPLEEGAFLGI